MTCVVGLEEGGRVWIAGDRLCTQSGGYISELKTPKVWKQTVQGGEEVLFGIAGKPRIQHILRFRLKLPELPKGDAVTNLVAEHWLEPIEKAFREHNMLKPYKDEGDQIPGTVLIGVRGTILEFDSNLSLGDRTTSYVAIGSGKEAARGVMYALQQIGSTLTPTERLELAVNSAAEQSNTVGGRVDVLSL